MGPVVLKSQSSIFVFQDWSELFKFSYEKVDWSYLYWKSKTDYPLATGSWLN